MPLLRMGERRGKDDERTYMNAPVLSFGRLRFTSAEENTVWPFYTQFFQDTYGCLQIHRDDTVLDAGASVGFFSIPTSPRCKKVIAVEPNRESFAALTRNRIINHASNIVTVNRALWGSPGFVRMAGQGVVFRIIPPDAEGAKSEYLPCTTVDQLLEELDCSVNVVKMDVEGAERACADGAYLRSVREIVVETHGTRDYILGLLRRHGFSTRVVRFNYAHIVRRLLRHLPEFSEAEISTKFTATRSSIMAVVKRQGIIPQRGDLDLDIVYGRKA